MAGTYQHYLQRMLQRGFKCPSSGKRPSVWVYPKDSDVIRKRTDKLGGEDEFYSPTSNGSTVTLDDRITAWEAHRQDDVRRWRQMPIGQEVESNAAAELVGLTGVRTRALRESFKTLFEELIPRFAETMQDPDVLMSHIDGRSDIEAALELSVATELGYSQEDLEAARAMPEFQAGMRMLKYAFSDVLGYRLSEALRALDRVFAEAFADDSFNAARLHGEAIGALLDSNTGREDLLSLSWSVEANQGDIDWILPDCAVLTMSTDGEFSPFLFGSKDERIAVLLPLSPQRMLVGLEVGEILPDLSDFTQQAARCSQQFFIAGKYAPELIAMKSMIGEAEWGEISEGLNVVLSGIDPLRIEREIDPIPATTNMNVSTHGLSLQESEIREIAEPLCKIVFTDARDLNLTRITKIVLCADVASALGERAGEPDLTYPNTSSRHWMSWLECGAGNLAYEVFIHANAAKILLDEEMEDHDYASSLFLQMLAQIHTRAVLTSSATSVDDMLDSMTQTEVGTFARNSAIDAAGTFMDNLNGSRIEPVGDDFTASTAQRFENALKSYHTMPLPREGSEEVRHHQAESFANAAAEVLVCACRHLAICQTRGVDYLDPAFASDELRRELKQLQLQEWLARLDFDLQRLRVNFHAPLDPERIIALQRHLECLFWARGAFLIASEEGGYILPYADKEVNYATLRLNLQDAIAKILPDELSEEFETLIR